MGLFRPSVKYAVRFIGELTRAKGEWVSRTEDEYTANTRRQKALGAHHIFCDSCIDFRGF